MISVGGMKENSAGEKKYSLTNAVVFLLAGMAMGAWLNRTWGQPHAAADKEAAAKKSMTVNMGGAANGKNKFTNPEDAKAALQRAMYAAGGAQKWRALLAFADSVDPAQLPDLLDMVRAMPNSPDRSKMEEALLDRWAGVNPGAAVAWAADLKNSGQRETALIDVFDAWSARDPAAALAAVDAKMNPHTRENVLNSVLNNYGAQNPTAALAALKGLPAEWGMGGLSQFIYENWARMDPNAAAAAVVDLPPGYAKMMALSRVAQAWTAQNPAEGMAWAQKQLGAGVSWYAVSGMTESNPEIAATFLDQLYNGNGRDNLTAGVARNMAYTDPVAALEWLNKNATGASYNKAMMELINNLGEDHAATLAPAVLQMPAGEERSNAIANLALQWSMADREAALAWAQSLPAADNATRYAALEGVVSVWSDNDPAAAVNFVNTQLAGDPNQAKLLQDTLNTWAVYDPQGALTWAQNLTDPAASAEALSKVIKGVTAANPQLGVQYAESLPAGEARDQAVANAAVIWSANNPTGAAALLNEIPAGDTRNSTAEQIATRWAKNDPGTASQWINSLPAGAARDSAVEGMITVVGKSDPASVFNWAASMDNETARLSQLRTTVQQWATTDATAAANAVRDATNLSNVQKADLLEAARTAAAAKKVGQF